MNHQQQLVTLQPVTMQVPNEDKCIYAVSKIQKPKVISEDEFLALYGDNPKIILLGDKQVTAYGFGLDCWYVLMDSSEDQLKWLTDEDMNFLTSAID